MKALCIPLFATLLPLAMVHADNGKVVEHPVAADTAAAFGDQVAAIRQQMNPGGYYQYITPADRSKVNTDLDDMTALLQHSGSVAAMSPADKVKLFNLQEHANGVLTHNDSNRLICEHVEPIGSHIPVTTCRTYGEIRRDREHSKRYLDQRENERVQTLKGN
ncbi:MAG: hypothetical protein ACYC7G_05170 [Rudaea sp.]